MRVQEIIVEQPEVIDRPPVRQREEVPLHIPGGATVVILNDPVTPAEVVVEAVVHGTGLSPDEAWRRVNRAHQGGWAAVASYASTDLAETVAERIMAHARNNTNYDHYRQFVRHQGPWPLTADVTEAGG